MVPSLAININFADMRTGHIFNNLDSIDGLLLEASLNYLEVSKLRRLTAVSFQ